MASVTLQDLITQSRYRADMINSDFVSDAELTTYLNASIAELYDILIQSYGSDYFVNYKVTNLSSGVDTYDINTLLGTTDFYKLHGVDAKIDSNTWSTLVPFNFNERNRFQHFNFSTYIGVTNLRYRLTGNNLIFVPIPEANAQVRIWYTPLAPKLSSLTDTISPLNGYEEYIIVDAAIKMLQKEESDVSVLMAQKAALKLRIEQAAQNRDEGKCDSISDIYSEGYRFWYTL